MSANRNNNGAGKIDASIATPERLISVVIHHGGMVFEYEHNDPYFGGSVEKYHHQDVDKLSRIVILRLLERAGYKDVVKIYYRNIQGYIRELDGDITSVAMTSLLDNNMELHIYVDHKELHWEGVFRLRPSYVYEFEFDGASTSRPQHRMIQEWISKMK